MLFGSVASILTAFARSLQPTLTVQGDIPFPGAPGPYAVLKLPEQSHTTVILLSPVQVTAVLINLNLNCLQ